MLKDNQGGTLEAGHNTSIGSQGSQQSVFKFNRSTASNNALRHFDSIKQILSKPAENRTTYELRTVLTPLMADIQFFKERKMKQ